MVPKKLDTIFLTWIISLFFSLSYKCSQALYFALYFGVFYNEGRGAFYRHMVQGWWPSKLDNGGMVGGALQA
ncbi:hypothetical protein ACS0TY_008698 [Phlomoides rotata]